MSDAKVGVYICSCDDISKAIDVGAVMAIAKNLPNVDMVRTHDHICRKDGLMPIENDIRAGTVNCVVLAGCSPRLIEKPFRNALEKFGLNKGLSEFVNLKEQCAFVHNDKATATEKAKTLIKMGIAKARLLEPFDEIEVDIIPSALVVGGGVAGMQAALDLGNQGFKTYLVEREPQLGGRTYQISRTFPTTNCGVCCMHDCKNCWLTPKMSDLYFNENIEVMTSSEVVDISGHIGDFRVKIKENGGTRNRDVNVGAIVVATGSQTFDPNLAPEYCYNNNKDVITSLELEPLISEMLRTGGELQRPSDKKIPKTINFIQCVGSRTEKNNLHCSLVCCTYAIGQAMEIKKRYPNANLYVHYMDLRGLYKGFEECYKEAQALGINFVRGRVSDIQKAGEKLLLRTEDVSLDETLEFESDLVVLSVGQEPSKGTETLAKMLRRELDIDGFYKVVNLEFSSCEEAGVFVAGSAQGPCGIRYAVADGKIAAVNASAILKKGRMKLDPVKSYVVDANCDGCAYCIEPCPYKAITLIEYARDGAVKKTVEVDEALCRGCGVCVATCPKKGIFVRGFKPEQLSAMVDAALEVT